MFVTLSLIGVWQPHSLDNEVRQINKYLICPTLEYWFIWFWFVNLSHYSFLDFPIRLSHFIYLISFFFIIHFPIIHLAILFIYLTIVFLSINHILSFSHHKNVKITTYKNFHPILLIKQNF